jgi:hypothetical protein
MTMMMMTCCHLRNISYCRSFFEHWAISKKDKTRFRINLKWELHTAYKTITILTSFSDTVKSKVVPVLNKLSTEPWRRVGSGCINLRILDLGPRWRWVVSFAPLTLYTRGKNPRYPMDRRLGEPRSLSWQLKSLFLYRHIIFYIYIYIYKEIKYDRIPLTFDYTPPWARYRKKYLGYTHYRVISLDKN